MGAKRKDRSLNHLLAAYLRSGPEERRSVLDYLRDENPHLFAHHPAEACFRQHVWHLAGFYWCKGCVMAASGMALGIILQLGFDWLSRFSPAEMAALLVGLLVPTLATLRFRGSAWLKHLARLLLGLASVSAFFYLFVTDSWLVRGVIILSFFAIRQPLVRYRTRMNRDLQQKG